MYLVILIITLITMYALVRDAYSGGGDALDSLMRLTRAEKPFCFTIETLAPGAGVQKHVSRKVHARSRHDCCYVARIWSVRPVTHTLLAYMLIWFLSGACAVASCR